MNVGADVNISDRNGFTPLMLAAIVRNKAIVSMVLQAGADMTIEDGNGTTALMLAAEEGNLDFLNIFMDSGADVNNALIEAIESNPGVCIENLAGVGADVNIMNSRGITILMITVVNDKEQAVHGLVRAGADVNISDQNGSTSLMLPAEYGNLLILEMLLQAGADVHAEDYYEDCTTLMKAAKNGQITGLIEAGSAINCRCKNGSMFAVKRVLKTKLTCY